MLTGYVFPDALQRRFCGAHILVVFCIVFFFKCLNLSIDIIRSCKFLLKTTEPAPKMKCNSSRTEMYEILKSYTNLKIGSHLYYACFCFTLTVLFMHTMFS